MYIDYLFFVSRTGEKASCMDEAAFSGAEFRARKIVDRRTQNRIRKMAEVPEAVRLLMVELVALEHTQGGAIQKNQPLQSFSNDGYSESYAEPLTTQKVQEIEEQLVLEYLSGEADDNGVPLLWLGVE